MNALPVAAPAPVANPETPAVSSVVSPVVVALPAASEETDPATIPPAAPTLG